MRYTKRRYGLIADTKNPLQDLHLFALGAPPPPAPPVVDLLPKAVPIVDQGPTNSCTGNATANHVGTVARLLGITLPPLSRELPYYGARVMEGCAKVDGGAQIRDVFKFYQKTGNCSEKEWPLLASTITKKPPAKVYADAGLHKILAYQRVLMTTDSIEAALATGFTFVAGISVYTSFESNDVANTGMVPMPKTGEKLLGGHGVHVCGYNRIKRLVWAQNSWGLRWGLNGTFSLPYGYLEEYGSDAWQATLTADQYTRVK